MTLSDLEWLSEIFSDTKHRAVSLRQLNVLFYCQWVAWMYCVRVQCWMASSRVDSIHFPSRTRKVCRSVAAPRRWKRCSFISLVNPSCPSTSTSPVAVMSDQLLLLWFVPCLSDALRLPTVSCCSRSVSHTARLHCRHRHKMTVIRQCNYVCCNGRYIEVWTLLAGLAQWGGFGTLRRSTLTPLCCIRLYLMWQDSPRSSGDGSTR